MTIQDAQTEVDQWINTIGVRVGVGDFVPVIIIGSFSEVVDWLLKERTCILSHSLSIVIPSL